MMLCLIESVSIDAQTVKQFKNSTKMQNVVKHQSKYMKTNDVPGGILPDKTMPYRYLISIGDQPPFQSQV